MKGFRKIVTIVAAAAVCAGASEIPLPFLDAENIEFTSNGYILGDVNGDEMVNAVDASLILAEYSAISTGQNLTFTELQKKAADINGDETYDSVDASIVLAYYSFTSTHDYISVEEFLEKEG